MSAEKLYGKQTELGVQNFGPGRRTVADVPALVKNYGFVKQAAARANAKLGVITAEQAEAIEAAAHEVATGIHDDQFPTALVLGGGGTTTNMNANEVIATRAAQIAGERIHPNDHVNASQSTNDSYPTAMALTVMDLAEAPIKALRALADEFDAKAAEYEDTVRLGRTCLQDAVTLTVGETHRSHSAAIRRLAGEFEGAVVVLNEVPLGATVLGSGIGAVEGYREEAVAELAKLKGRALKPAPDMFDSLSNLDGYASIAHAASRAALTMAKIAQDLRMLSSGPLGGLQEVTLPAVQAGSSIMPGKINPVIPEYVMQLSYRVRGAASTVEMAVAAGELELNIMEPIIVDSLINIFEDVESAATVFGEECVRGLKWEGSRLDSNAEVAFDRWVTMSADVGYGETTKKVREYWAGA
ncbi:lyase family protein [Ancrocorticia populi]|uniref:lyase family protein n=1 Tax=Ancrocorticia populi TaxID=2175228 RepID=UPI003F8E9F37